MFFGLSSTNVSLLVLGGLLVVLAQAIMRRDPAWILAIGLPMLLCADHVGVSADLIAWGYAAYALILFAAVVAVITRLLGAPNKAGLLGALAGIILLAGMNDVGHFGLESPSLRFPPQLGIQLADWARAIDASHAAP
jgi:hypothetical protein